MMDRQIMNPEKEKINISQTLHSEIYSEINRNYLNDFPQSFPENSKQTPCILRLTMNFPKWIFPVAFVVSRWFYEIGPGGEGGYPKNLFFSIRCYNF